MAENYIPSGSHRIQWDGTATTIGGTTFQQSDDPNNYDYIDLVFAREVFRIKPGATDIMLSYINSSYKARVYFASVTLTWTSSSVAGAFNGRSYYNLPTATGNVTGGSSTVAWPVYKIWGVRV